ncbi:hypothetical protein ACVWXU_008382 [Streptomyces sp. TE33382]
MSPASDGRGYPWLREDRTTSTHDGPPIASSTGRTGQARHSGARSRRGCTAATDLTGRQA